MELRIEKDYESLSAAAATEILQHVKNNPETLICLAAGDTPKMAYSFVVQQAKLQRIDFSRIKFVALDEWIEIPPGNEGSCQYFLRNLLTSPLQLPEKNLHFFNALSADLHKECADMDKFIKKNGPVSLMLVGVGRNGHIGFNEPGVPFDKYCHVVDLDDITRNVGQKYFKEATTLTKGITLGLKHLLESGKVIVMANGIKKAEVMKLALEGEISPEMPVTIIRRHPNGIVMIDKEAASLLDTTRT